MDEARANALKEKQDLEARLAKVNQFLALYDEFSGTKREGIDTPARIEAVRFAGGETPSARRSATADPIEPPPFTEQVVPPRKLSPAELVALAQGAMKDLNRPLTRGDLVNELERRGAMLPGSDRETKARYLGTIMWRKQEVFENIEGRGYWLKGRPVPDPVEQARLKLSE